MKVIRIDILFVFHMCTSQCVCYSLLRPPTRWSGAVRHGDSRHLSLPLQLVRYDRVLFLHDLHLFSQIFQPIHGSHLFKYSGLFSLMCRRVRLRSLRRRKVRQGIHRDAATWLWRADTHANAAVRVRVG